MDKIEKKLRKRGMQKIDKFAHNPYHVDKPSFFSRIPLWGKIAIPASLVTAVTVVAFFGVVNGVAGSGFANRAPASNNKGEASTSAINKAGSESQADVTSLNPGESSTPANQNHLLSVNGKDFEFLTKQTKEGGEQGGMYAVIEEENLGDFVGETIYETTGEKINLYEIKNYSSDVFLAARMPGYSEIYACYNPNSTFLTINDFLNQIPFLTDSSIENSKITVFEDLPENAIYKNADTETINSYLFTDTGSASNTTSFRPAPGERFIIMPFTLNTFDSECVTIVLYRGYMQIKVGFDSANDKNVYEVGTDIYTTVETYVKSLTKVNG